MNKNDTPRLRSVEPLPIEIEGEKMVALRDPRALSTRTMFLSPPSFVVATTPFTRTSPTPSPSVAVPSTVI